MLCHVFYLWFYFVLAVAAGDCETVVNLWKILGRGTEVDPANLTACCTGIAGITCDGSNVTAIVWNHQFSSGVIPPQIGDLVNLKVL